jgi:hypothetical protein
LAAPDRARIELMQESNERRPVLTILIATLIVGLPLIVAVIALAQRRWFPVLDLAMTEFRVRDVGGRYTPLIGLPGRIGTFPDQGSHPGPLSFWLIAPGYRLFGSSAWAMEAATVTIQVAWIGVALWIGHRRAGVAGLVVVAAVLAVLTRGYGLTVLVQPWNPYLPVFAWIVVLLATWSVLCGDHMMLVPLAVASTYCAQTHIPYLTIAGALGLLSVGVVLVRCWRSDDRRSFVRPLAWTGGVFAVLWLAPLADQIRRDPGNIRRLLDHFTSPTEEAIGLRRAFEVLLRHLDVVDGHAALLTGTQRFVQVGLEPDGRVWPGAVLLALWIGAVVVAVRLRHRSLVALHTVIGVTLVLSLLSMARIFGKVWYYLTLWAWGTTTLMIVAIVWTAVTWYGTRDAARETPSSTPSTRQVGLVGGLVVAGVVVVSMVVIAPSTDHPEERLGETIGELLQPTVDALEQGIGSADGPDGRYVVRYNDSYFFGSQAYGLVSELERAGLDAGMNEPWRVPVTQHRVIPLEQTTAEVIWATGGFVDTWRNDDRVVEVAAYDPRSDEERAESDELRSALIEDLKADGLDDLIPLVDTDLFAMYLDPRLSAASQERVEAMLVFGRETAVFIGPPGVTL